MLAHVNGLVAEKEEGTLVIECGGVGYQLTVSAATLSQAPAMGERMKCYTHLSVREDAVELFGFATREEKRMFLKLTAVSGIGPKSAIQVLSALSLRDLSLAIVTGDAAALTRAPGIGKKTAQRMILELKDKVDNAELTASGAPLAAVSGGAADEAIEALMALGYQASEAARAVGAVSPIPDNASEIVRLALKGMMK
ncbi:MAG: Holliday junction branch migration protein RuvA [Clostridia bacterium]|nr:Holliday junction branch migration protein RuvA [Clostridia bacterium]